MIPFNLFDLVDVSGNMNNSLHDIIRLWRSGRGVGEVGSSFLTL